MQRSERHATAVSNHPIRGLLHLSSISTTPQERHCTRAGRQQASEGRPDDLTNLCPVCPLKGDLRAGINCPWLQSPW